jgi:putative ABC transport system substrate-binding protein
MLSGRPLAESIYARPIVRRLAELGYRDGAGTILEYRSTDGFIDRYPAQARELIDLKCDVIIAIGAWQPARALRDLRSPVPTVFFAGDYDPVEKGIVSSLSRPDGNMTGVYAPQALLAAKRLQILREVLPAARHFLVLADAFSRDHLDAVRKAGEAVGVDITVVEFLNQPYDFAGAFETGRQAGVEGVLLLNSPVFASHLKELSALIAKHRLPAVGAGYPGIMIGYHGDLQKGPARAAEIAVRILKGAKPADIPVEQIDEFVLVINAKTARALGVKIPESVLARATRIIE